jgi:tetratricopeptide (TPR) repeat protein
MDLSIRQHLRQQNLLFFAAIWILLFAATVFVYWPGLSGPFLLDDYGSIGALAKYGGVRDWDTFRAFVFGGHAGPSGRPLALLSFLIDGNNWPTDPWPFKRTNLIIHLVTGAMLGILISKILRVLEFETRDVRWIAFLSTACWMLHPFLVSTTLYPVQRMAQLSTLFIFAGLAAYIHGRILVLGNAKRAYWIMTSSLGIFTVLAVLAKENGILLPILIGVIEVTIFAGQRARFGCLNRLWIAVFVVFPSFAIVSYLGVGFVSTGPFEILTSRDFNLYERVLTQSRILVDYLMNWFIPKLYTTGVFQDHFIKSTGFLSPVSTLFSTAFHIAAIGAAVIYRKKQPLLAMAVLMFYGGHLLESTVVPLELYFEHRNYMPACFLFLPLVACLWRKLSGSNFLIAGVVALSLLGGFTRYSATVWQTLPSIIEASARKAPTSPRAQAQYATLLFNAGQENTAVAVLDRAIAARPDVIPLLLINRLIALCNLNSLSLEDFENTAIELSSSRYDARVFRAYTKFSEAVVEKRCPTIAIQDLEQMYVSMFEIPAHNDPTSLAFVNLKFLLGLVYVHSGRPDDALSIFQESLAAKPEASYAMVLASHMASVGHNFEALILSNLALGYLEPGTDSFLNGTLVLESDIKNFQDTVRSDMGSEPDSDR